MFSTIFIKGENFVTSSMSPWMTSPSQKVSTHKEKHLDPISITSKNENGEFAVNVL